MGHSGGGDQTSIVWSLISCDTVKFYVKLWIGKYQYIFLGICCWDLTSIPRNFEKQSTKYKTFIRKS